MRKICKYLLLVFLFLFTSVLVSSQVKNGLYYGGKHLEGSRTYGYYYFFNDSSFIMLHQQERDSVARNVGFGTWKYSKKQLTLHYQKPAVSIFYNGTIDYTSKAIANYDSTLISGQVFLMNKPAHSSIVFPEIKTTVTSNGEGNFKVAFAGNKPVNKMQIFFIEAQPLEIVLDPKFNSHQFKIVLAHEQEVHTKIIEPVTERYKYLRRQKGRDIFTHFFVLEDISEKNVDIPALLKKNASLNPFAKKLFNWFEAITQVK